jgi:PadR family transcriptional regulator PadR
MSHEHWQEQLRRGTLEMAVLFTIAARRRYGLEIIKHLEATQLVLSEGVIYPILARLERDGLLRAEWVSDEGPHPRKYYEITPRGRSRLLQMRLEFREFTDSINALAADALGEDA